MTTPSAPGRSGPSLASSGVVFETQRLRGRRPTEDDEPRYRDLFFTPEVAAWLRPPPLAPFTLDDPARGLHADLRRFRNDGFGFAILESTADGSFLGRGGLAITAVEGVRAVEIGWALLPAHWGRGLATEMARGGLAWAWDLGLPEVVAFTVPDNVASRRVMEKVGMAYEGEIVHAKLPHVLYRVSRPTLEGIDSTP